jgi:RuvA, C-terminal domain
MHDSIAVSSGANFAGLSGMTKARPRPLLGSVLILGALFLENARQCGMVGRWLATGAGYLIGTHGTLLVAIGLGGAGIAIALPSWLRRVVIRLERMAGPPPARSPAAPALHLLRTHARPAAKSGTTVTREAPPEPRKLADVRSALRHLGYSAAEIATVWPRLDPRHEVTEMIRDALKLLREGSANGLRSFG